MSDDLDNLVDLYRAIKELRRKQELLAGVPDWMGELHEEHSARQAEITALEEAVQEAEGERRAAEAIAEDCQQKLAHFQEQIGQVRNQREYAALLQEIDTIKEQIRLAEEQALAAMELQDEAQKPLEEKQGDFSAVDDKYSEALEQWETEKPGVAREAEILEGRIEVLRERLPAQILALFDRIMDHHGDALAPVRAVDRTGKGSQMWHCGACNYSVRPQSVVAIRNQGSILQCDSCKRFLYFTEAPD